MSIRIVTFVSDRHRGHGYLPSFPTRRSSDLGEPDRRPVEVAQRLANGFGGVAAGDDDVVYSVTGEPVDHVGDVGAAGERERRDRKSTRLNSSHGYISYAVFCLKKKN